MISITKEQFIKQLNNAVSVGSVFDNPGGGTSVIVGIGDDKLSYIRGSSRMYLPYVAIVDMLDAFSGKTATTNDLKEHNPAVFDTKRGGHDCNCTVTFCILERIGLTDGSIKGSGRRGSPFFVIIK